MPYSFTAPFDCKLEATMAIAVAATAAEAAVGAVATGAVAAQAPKLLVEVCLC